MISKSLSSQTNHSDTLEKRRQQIKEWMQHCRQGTLKLFEGMDYQTFCQQVHPDFSPVGWHLGHIAYTESLWLLEKKSEFKQYDRLFAADGLPKGERVNLPTLPEIHNYLDTVRNQVFDRLELAPLDEQERLWRFILQHESQHGETIAFLLQLQRWPLTNKPIPHSQLPIPDFEMIKVAAGEFEMGNNFLDALDNERPKHRVDLDTYWIDRYPVTCGQYRQFIEAGSYQNSKLWSPEGWEWVQANAISQPLYWLEDSAWNHHPVCGVSWYEADAYSRFIGKRLPTEAEWEKAASWDATTGKQNTYPWGETPPNIQVCNHDNIHKGTTPVNAYPSGASACGLQDALGNVWEWTSSLFDNYEGFEYYPYRGYSQVYFDRQHRVLKGGSWATRPWGLRCSFRNWYHPYVRQIMAGFRCVST